MSNLSQESGNFESSSPLPPENGISNEHLKKALIGAYHRILLAMDSYAKGYISYKEWHQRLEKEIQLTQTYKATLPRDRHLLPKGKEVE